jgi:hypothetical protein
MCEKRNVAGEIGTRLTEFTEALESGEPIQGKFRVTRMREEEWSDSEAVVAECDNCCRVLKVLRLGDPLQAEMYPDDPIQESWWCRTCFVARANEV